MSVERGDKDRCSWQPAISQTMFLDVGALILSPESCFVIWLEMSGVVICIPAMISFHSAESGEEGFNSSYK
jgi:hypothetical protein